MPKIIAFDIEADNLLIDATKIWCCVTCDLDTGEWRWWGPDEIESCFEYLLTADRLLAHNGINFDVPTMERLAGKGRRLPFCIDTLLISRLLWPDRFTHPAGGSALADWGRYLKFPKTEFHDWTKFSEDMLWYCFNDVELLVLIYNYLLPKARKFKQAVKLEHEVARIITRQQINGFTTKKPNIEQLLADLGPAKEEVERKLQEAFPPKVIKTEMKTPDYWITPAGFFPTKGDAKKAGWKDKDIIRGPNWVKETIVPFNPNSALQIIERFEEKYDWKPEKFSKRDDGEQGQACTDQDVLESLSYPEAELLVLYRLVNNRHGNAETWLEWANKYGKIHGEVNTNGCQTGRMSHSNPNVNFPRVQKYGKGHPLAGQTKKGLEGRFGYECRSCFGPREGWVQVGVDASGLELRMLANRLFPYDGGAYADIVLKGDVHSANQQAAGLDTRDDAKTFIYAYCYGAGDAKLGSIKAPTASEAEQRRIGAELRKRFETNLEAFGEFKADIIRQVRNNKYLVGLDGRHLPIRSEHAAINTQLQSDGAIVMKQGLVLVDQYAIEAGLMFGELWEFLANVHDEWQREAQNRDIAVKLGELGCKAIADAGPILGCKVPLAGEYKIGYSWRVSLMVQNCVSIIVPTTDGRYLMLQRSPKNKYANLWSMPGGKVDGDERLFDAARRELFEETGLQPNFAQMAVTLPELPNDLDPTRSYVEHVFLTEEYEPDFLADIISLESTFTGYGLFTKSQILNLPHMTSIKRLVEELL